MQILPSCPAATGQQVCHLFLTCVGASRAGLPLSWAAPSCPSGPNKEGGRRPRATPALLQPQASCKGHSPFSPTQVGRTPTGRETPTLVLEQELRPKYKPVFLLPWLLAQKLRGLGERPGILTPRAALISRLSLTGCRSLGLLFMALPGGQPRESTGAGLGSPPSLPDHATHLRPPPSPARGGVESSSTEHRPCQAPWGVGPPQCLPLSQSCARGGGSWASLCGLTLPGRGQVALQHTLPYRALPSESCDQCVG